MNDYKITLEIKAESARLDQSLLEALRKQTPGISRNLLKSWFQEQKIYLAGRPVKPSLMLAAPGVYEIQLRNLTPAAFGPPQASASLHPERLQIVYEDARMLIINKNSGMPSIPHSSAETETAVGLALAHCPELVGIGRSELEPGLLHRLDTGTSGLLVFAKSQMEFERLSTVWKNRNVEKTYRAWVAPNSSIPLLRGFQLTESFQVAVRSSTQKASQPSEIPFRLPLRIDLPLAHDAKSAKRMLAWNESSRAAIRGKPLPAVTHLISLHSRARLIADTQVEKHIFDLEIRIETGVMHQIRCHLASLNYPILGDTIYKGAPSPRLWLHAWRLSLPNSEGKLLKFEAELPANWNKQAKE